MLVLLNCFKFISFSNCLHYFMLIKVIFFIKIIYDKWSNDQIQFSVVVAAAFHFVFCILWVLLSWAFVSRATWMVWCMFIAALFFCLFCDRGNSCVVSHKNYVYASHSILFVQFVVRVLGSHPNAYRTKEKKKQPWYRSGTQKRATHIKEIIWIAHTIAKYCE